MPTTAIASLDDVKAEINDVSNVNDTELGGFMTAATSVIEDLVGPVLTAQTTEPYDGGGLTVVLRKYPLVSVDTVTEYQGTSPNILTSQVLGVATTFDGFGYTADLGTGVLHRTSGGSDAWFAAGRGNIVVTYTYGRAVVPGNIRLAFLELIRIKWSPQRSAGPDTLDPSYQPAPAGEVMRGVFVPDAVLVMLAPDRRAPRVG